MRCDCLTPVRPASAKQENVTLWKLGVWSMGSGVGGQLCWEGGHKAAHSAPLCSRSCDIVVHISRVCEMEDWRRGGGAVKWREAGHQAAHSAPRHSRSCDCVYQIRRMCSSGKWNIVEVECMECGIRGWGAVMMGE